MSGITWFTRAEGGPTQANKCAFSIRRLLSSKGNRKRGYVLKLGRHPAGLRPLGHMGHWAPYRSTLESFPF